MPKMVVINKGLHYAGKSYEVGEPFEATHVDAGWLKKTLRADFAPANPAPMGEVVSVRPAQREIEATLEVEASEADAEAFTGASEPVSMEVTARRTYRRRDLKAED